MMTDNVITEFLRKRTIMSDFQLIEYIIHSDNLYQSLPPVNNKLVLSEEDLILLLDSWKQAIETFAKFLEKGARSVLAKTNGVVLYHIDNKNKLWEQAALICEIFRYPGISKNSSQLDIRSLQKKIVHLLAQENLPLELVIAWGQAKQTCGLLKTPGSMADLAEVFAVVQLSVIVHAVKRIVGNKKEVKLKVLTGASRFAVAFYPDVQETKEYDAQRQTIANYFNPPGSLVFQSFSNEELTALDHESPRMHAFAENCLLVKPQHVDRIYNHILLSINWHRVLANQHTLAYGLTKDNKTLLSLVQAWIKDKTCFETVLRRALVSLLRRQDLFTQEPDHQDWINLTVLMDEITRDSSKKYIALQYTDSGFDVNNYVSDEKNHFIRLTVHEKKDRADIPAIFTLGKLGGNYLSQNVTVYLDKQGETRFKSLAEILGEYQVKAVYVDKACNKSLPLSWLSEHQPLCFVDQESITEKVPPTLKLAFKSWLEGMMDI
jgi:hypothetical protein